MTRIFITGNSGSGKTTLARRVGDALGLPVFGLDQIVWLPGWRKSPPERRLPLEADWIARPDWVIEGVSSRVLAAADVVIFLDMSRTTSFRRSAGRNWRYLFRSRPGLPENCPEILIIPRHIRIIWNFPARIRPGILAAIEARAKADHIVRNADELAAALRAIGVSES
jgi:adenylate kinase family enzyme